MTARRTVLIVVLVVAVLALLVIAASTVVFVAIGTCDGDGGSPYSARDSVAGGFCDGPLVAPWAVATLIVPALVALVLGVVAVKRVSVALLAIGLAGGAVTLILLAGTVLALPGDCSGSDQRAYDRWIDSDRSGPRPADCETY